MAKRGGVPIGINLRQRRRVLTAALAFHPLREALLNPGGRTATRFLAHEAMRELVFENAREFRRHGGQSLHRDADAAVVECPHPAGSFGYVREGLLGIQNYTNGIRRRETQF